MSAPAVAQNALALYRELRTTGETVEDATRKVAHAYGRHWEFQPDHRRTLRETEAELTAGEVRTE